MKTIFEILKNIFYKKYFSLILLFFIISLIKDYPIDDDFSQKIKWDEKALFQYTKNKYISEENINEIKELKYLIVDPNEYLKSEDIIESSQKLELLYKEFNITFFIFIINSIKENSKLNYQLRDFMSSINSEIYKYNKNYKEKIIISVLFAVENNKMFIRVGSECRKILSDSEAIKILNKRKEDLNNKNFKKLIYELINDISVTYKNNYEQSLNKNIPSILKIFFYMIIIILFGYIYYHFIKINFSTKKLSDTFIEMKSQYGKKLKEFIKKNINKSIEKVMDENCLICLENYKNKKNDNILFETEESKNEKISLPCEHIFHLKCVSQWCLSKNNNCPLCKSEFEINSNEDGDFNINNYILNKNWKYNKSIVFKNIIKDFLNIQKNINPEDVNDDFWEQINNEYLKENKNNNFKNVKIRNTNKGFFI